MQTNSLIKLEKSPTGIHGLDQITLGGLPKGRPTLVAGSAGSGKTLLAIGFVLNGIQKYHEPGVFISFDETSSDLAVNIASLGYPLQELQAEKKLKILHMNVDPLELIETGDFDLSAIFIRIGAAIDEVGARRIALDGVENLFAAFADTHILRSEFRRLVDWLKAKGITAIITTERGTNSITLHGLQEYIADCVITLDNRIVDQISTRRLRIVKYRGSAHDGDECPFILNEHGISVIPISSAGLGYQVTTERISLGIESLDTMLTGGLFRGSSVLVTGTAGTGKSSIAAQMVDAACRRGERCLYVALEEAPLQIERNMTSIGINLEQWRTSDMLRFYSARPTSSGLEMHLAVINQLVDEFAPSVVIIDPITALTTSSEDESVKLMLIRAIDLFKSKGITSLFTALTSGNTNSESTAIGISSLMDIWFLLRNIELSGERTRGLYVCKARGMAHSNQIREFTLTDNGVKMIEVQLADSGEILTGSARQLHLKQKEIEVQMRQADETRRRSLLENRRLLLEAKITAMRVEFEEDLRLLESDLLQDEMSLKFKDQANKDQASLRSVAD